MMGGEVCGQGRREGEGGSDIMTQQYTVDLPPPSPFLGFLTSVYGVDVYALIQQIFFRATFGVLTLSKSLLSYN